MNWGNAPLECRKLQRAIRSLLSLGGRLYGLARRQPLGSKNSACHRWIGIVGVRFCARTFVEGKVSADGTAGFECRRERALEARGCDAHEDDASRDGTVLIGDAAGIRVEHEVVERAFGGSIGSPLDRGIYEREGSGCKLRRRGSQVELEDWSRRVTHGGAQARVVANRNADPREHCPLHGTAVNECITSPIEPARCTAPLQPIECSHNLPVRTRRKLCLEWLHPIVIAINVRL